MQSAVVQGKQEGKILQLLQLWTLKSCADFVDYIYTNIYLLLSLFISMSKNFCLYITVCIYDYNIEIVFGIQVQLLPQRHSLCKHTGRRKRTLMKHKHTGSCCFCMITWRAYLHLHIQLQYLWLSHYLLGNAALASRIYILPL